MLGQLNKALPLGLGPGVMCNRGIRFYISKLKTLLILFKEFHMLQKMIQVFSLDLVKVMPAALSLLKIMNPRKFLGLFLEV